MKKLLAKILAVAMCFSCTTFTGVVQAVDTAGDSGYAITFANPENGTLTATVDGEAITTGAKVAKGKTVTFTAEPTDDTKTYTVAWTGDGVKPVAETLRATLVVSKVVTVGATLTEKATGGDTFTVKVEQSNGGLLDIYDTTAEKYLPIGEDVVIAKGNVLRIESVNANGTLLDAVTVNDKPLEASTVTVTENMTLKATFKAGTGGDPEESDETYWIDAVPNEFINAEPAVVSGNLKLFYWDGNWDHEDKLLSGTVFKFSAETENSDNDKFTLTEAGAFASKDKLSDGYYTLLVDATQGGKAHTAHVYITVLKQKMTRVQFRRYIAENANGSITPRTVEVASGTKFGAVTKPAVIPQMYNHAALPGWFDYNNDAKISDDFAVTKVLTARVKYESYKITMLGLDGKPETDEPDEPEIPDRPSGGGSSGGSSGGGGGGSIIKGGGGISGSTSGSATVTTGTAAKEATKAVENAVKAAARAGYKSANAAVTFKNVKSMSPDVFKAINTAAAKASKGVAVKTAVQMDTVVGGKVTARMYIDPTLAAGLKTAIKTTVDVSPKGKDNAKTVSVMSQYYNNTAVVVSFAQQGTFGMNVQAAVKIDTARMNTKTLMFYSYDAKTNKFTAITAPAYFVDSAGFLHFTTPVGGSIVITDKPLTRK